VKTFDVVVVGSGTAGQTAAYMLAEAGLQVAVADDNPRPGGICALAGCQAKKWFYEATETVARSRHLAGIGIRRTAQADWGALRDQKNRFTEGIPSATVEGFSRNGIAFLPGTARFEDPVTLGVGDERVSAARFVLATGAQPMPLPFDGAANLTTSDAFLELNQLPRRLVFVGGGFIAFEFAHFAARLGDVEQITILEAAARPLAPFDAEMVEVLVEASREEGVTIRTGVTIEAVRPAAGAQRVHLAGGEVLEADGVVHAAGRAPNIEALSLGRGQVEYSPRGIAVDATMRTSNDRVYAIGDCAATIQLARVADYEAQVAGRNILAGLRGGEGAAMDYGTVPTLLFTYPQYGMVGATESALRARGKSYRKSFAQALAWPTYQRIGLRHAAYKVLADDKGRVLGAHFIADQAGGVINAFTQAMRDGKTVEALYHEQIMSPYPTRESDMLYMLKPLRAG